MNEAELKKIVDAWIKGQESTEGSPAREENWWAIDSVIDWAFDGKAELLWRFILLAYKREMSDTALSVLAAGPVEDLLSKFGASYIDSVEKLAKEDNRFNYLLGGVWQHSMDDAIWKRITTVRKTVW
jgi:hypothetical protein